MRILKLLICALSALFFLTAPQNVYASGRHDNSESGMTLSENEKKIIFQSGSCNIAGFLRSPEGDGPHPVVIFIHGDGPATHTSGGYYLPIMDRMLRVGYAVFSWDKPGSGRSTGQLDIEHLFKNRAQIALDAIAVLKKQTEIDPTRMGLWGSSQAGYVIPLILENTPDINFLIAVSCPGEASVDQWAYLIKSQAICAGVPLREAELLDESIAGARRARTYDEYLFYKGIISKHSGLLESMGYKNDVKIIPEEQWKPKDLNDREFFNPVLLMEKINIPVLAVYGEKDAQVDPLQGMQAYKRIRDISGNKDFTISFISGVDHSMIKSKTGCKDERRKRTAEEWRNIAGEYLDIIAEWLRTHK
jgi:dipeptidyl aminopeptidase/acylaminoacyl peptidase